MGEGVILFLEQAPLAPASEKEVSHKLLTDPGKPPKK